MENKASPRKRVRKTIHFVENHLANIARRDFRAFQRRLTTTTPGSAGILAGEFLSGFLVDTRDRRLQYRTLE
jgi:hypothetical protein